MNLIHHGSFELRSAGRPPTRCRLRVYRGADGWSFAVATELGNNPGRSVTNAAEDLRAAVIDAFALDPAKLNWVEHYHDDDGPDSDRYSVVNFDGPGLTSSGGDPVRVPHLPRWAPIGKVELECAIGQELDESDCPPSYGS